MHLQLHLCREENHVIMLIVTSTFVTLVNNFLEFNKSTFFNLYVKTCTIQDVVKIFFVNVIGREI